MRRAAAIITLLLGLGIVARPAYAQLVDLTDDRTAEQKWMRSTYLSTFMSVSAIAYAKSVGQTPEHFARFLGKTAGPGWGSETPAAFVRGVYRNYRMYDGLVFEILEESDDEIRASMNLPYGQYFGEDGEMEGVTLEEFVHVFSIAYETIADHLGFDMTHEWEGAYIVLAVRSRP